MKITFASILIFSLACLASSVGPCLHDHVMSQAKVTLYNDFNQLRTPALSRLLQGFTIFDKQLIRLMERIRIFIDKRNVKIGEQKVIDTINRAMDIAVLFVSNLVKVSHLDVLKFPSNTQLKCNLLDVLPEYVTDGVTGDLGLIVGNEVSTISYVAKSGYCVQLASNKRPIWGMIMWNNQQVDPSDTYKFQTTVFVGVHELMHLLAFSSKLYDSFPAGNPLVEDNGMYYLATDKIKEKIKDHFNCANPIGLPLEDQDGDIISSHVEKKVFYNELMVAVVTTGVFVGATTLALLGSTGWYIVDESYAETTGWGKGEGCGFLDVDNCDFPDEFCNKYNTAFGQYERLFCNGDNSAFGLCRIDPFSGACKIINRYSNTNCKSSNYLDEGLLSSPEYLQYDGSSAFCLTSNKTVGSMKSDPVEDIYKNFRCHKIACSSTSEQYYLIYNGGFRKCTPGSYYKFTETDTEWADLDEDGSMEKTKINGAILCPDKKDKFCSYKGRCLNDCSFNGICLNNQCYCYTGDGSWQPSSVCLDTVKLESPTTTSSKRVKEKVYEECEGIIFLKNRTGITSSRLYSNDLSETLYTDYSPSDQSSQSNIVEKQTYNVQCIGGTYKDPIFGECTSCIDRFGCNYCTAGGCWGCPDGSQAVNGSCFRNVQLNTSSPTKSRRTRNGSRFGY